MWKVSLFGVILVRIFLHLVWMRIRITSNTDAFYAVISFQTICSQFCTVPICQNTKKPWEWHFEFGRGVLYLTIETLVPAEYLTKFFFGCERKLHNHVLILSKKIHFFNFKKNILRVALPLFWKLESWTTMNNWHLFTNRQKMRHFLKIIPVTFPTHKLRQDRQNMFFFQITANSPYP